MPTPSTLMSTFLPDIFNDSTNLANSTATWSSDVDENTTTDLLGNGNTTADFLGNQTQSGNDFDPNVAFWHILQYRVGWYINRNALPIISVLAVLGNTAILVTLSRIRPVTSSACFMSGLAVCDMLAILIKLLYLNMTGYRIRLYDVGCKVIHLLMDSLPETANWICVAMAIERCIAVWFPLKVSTLCTPKTAGWVLLGLTVCFHALGIHYLFTAEEQESWIDRGCGTSATYLYLASEVMPWFHWAAVSFLPCTLLVVLNGLIIAGLKRAAKRKQALTSAASSAQLKHQQKERQITRMLVTVSVALIVLTTPYAVFLLVIPYWDYRATLQATLDYMFTAVIVVTLSEFNHAVNFFLYFLSGRKFRNAFTRLICHCCRRFRARKNKDQTVPTTPRPQVESTKLTKLATSKATGDTSSPASKAGGTSGTAPSDAIGAVIDDTSCPAPANMTGDMKDVTSVAMSTSNITGAITHSDEPSGAVDNLGFE
jgi:hypothetical protein